METAEVDCLDRGDVYVETAKTKRKHKRQKWSKSWDFVFALLGGSIGLGNVWRFPYLCFKNGGGAFLVPYIFFVVMFAIPLVILETSFGQRVGRGVMQSWSGIPIMKGIAFAQTMVLFHFTTSYQVILAWALKYFVKSFSSVLPWSTCGNPWNSERCISTQDLEAGGPARNSTFFGDATNSSVVNLTSSATEYWFREVLGVSPGIDHPGSFRQDLVLYLAILWLGMFLATFKGIKWSAKVVYITASLPFLLIIAVLVRGATLEGAANGIKYYLIPDAQKLLKLEGGVYIFVIYNNYGASGWCLFLIATCEFLSISWLYGFNRYWAEIEDMVGPKKGKIWIKLSWLCVGPTIAMVIFAYYVVVRKPLKYLDYVFPPWAQAIAHLMSFSSVVFIPGYALYKVASTYLRDGKLTKAIYCKPIARKSCEIEKLASESEKLQSS